MYSHCNARFLYRSRSIVVDFLHIFTVINMNGIPVANAFILFIWFSVNLCHKSTIIPFCKHVVAKVILVLCSVNLTGKREKAGHRDTTINTARIIRLSGIYEHENTLKCMVF